ncbi:LAME_0H01596g1_1 [Lachancea meyersii CBS 8951]|uniref:LAME_0H01596g1_1 n=1 Tax=Lachancea meyersii CBS 8951 TaxID=1266667 RepID=A0A1G4KDN1_9SACH|nr:LAME_0H01596g1_1 [Lachancea meyersii CBS 8951]
MEKGKSSQKQGLMQIPEAIDPGITLPLYEDELNDNDPNQPQKLGSYRVRAGKFSNTLSNLLPSISAKLHHSRKASGTPKHTSETAVSGSSSNNTSRSQMSLSGQITPPEASQPVSEDMLGRSEDPFFGSVMPPRTSGESFSFNTSGPNLHATNSNTVSRTRNNTVSSQITSLSGMPPTTGSLWSTNTSPNEAQVISGLASAPFASASPLNDYSSSTYFDVGKHGSTAATHHNTSNLTVPGVVPGITQNSANGNTGNIWNTRQRSHSNASSIYTDAPIYENKAMNRSRASTFGLGLEPTPLPVHNHTAARQHTLPSPLVVDDIDPRSINWVTTDPSVPAINQISTLLPTNTVSISNVYSLQQQQPKLADAVNLTSMSLATLCMKFGIVMSARTLKRINMALVEFDSVESAMRAKDGLHGKEVSLVGAPSSVSFAKVLPMHQQAMSSSHSLASNSTAINGPQSLLQEQLYNGALTFQQQGNVSIPVLTGPTQQQAQPIVSQPQTLSQHPQSQSQQQSHSNANSIHHATPSHGSSEKEHCPFPLPPPNFSNHIQALEDIINSFGASHDSAQTKHIINNALLCSGTTDTADFGPLPDPLPNREFDAPKLREIRKAIDSNCMSELDIEQLAIAMLDELPELCSDYLGNTIVQKLFDHSSTVVKDIMLRRTNSFLTSMGVHKNGTWACQKIITKADTPRQKMLVAKGVEKYCTPLFNDQFGNYVTQCVLKFGFPWNNFIFEHIISNFWTIAQNRYGARAVRACLEAHDLITREQLLVLSGMIVSYTEYLATNSNGALLVTWFLDTCTLPHRHSILAPRLVVSMAEMCCHKLASLTVLKVLNYRGDERAKRLILDTIFGKKDSTYLSPLLFRILCDTNYGPTFLYKVLSMSLLEGDVRVHVVQQVRQALMEINPTPQHRRLMEEVGLGGAAVVSTATPSTASSSSKHRPSISQVFNSDGVGHVRNVSVGSNLSNGSRPRALSNSGLAAIPAGTAVSGAASFDPVSLNLGPNQNQKLTASSGYYNYPGGYPIAAGNSRGAYSMNGDDLSSQFDMLNFQNNTQISLPQISMSNSNKPAANNNSNNINNNYLKPSSSNNGSIYGSYGY